MKRVFKITAGEWDERPEVGKSYILTSRYNELTGAEWYHIRPWIPEKGGVPGNMNSEVKRYHGWRGTYNNIATYAHGVRQVEEIISYKEGWGEDVYKVRFTDKDLVADED